MTFISYARGAGAGETRSIMDGGDNGNGNAMRRPWVVLKFGGTSVATGAGWERIAARVAELAREYRVLVVVSAIAGVSDLLQDAVVAATQGAAAEQLERIREEHRRLATELDIDATEPAELAAVASLVAGIELTAEASPKLLARVLAAGELSATRLGVAALRGAGLDVARVDARELLESVPAPSNAPRERYLRARVAPATDPAKVAAVAGEASVVLTQGFIARTPQGDTCVLGRGGGDTSAALLAALVAAERLEICSDVHGLFTADPRSVPEARLIRRLGYREAEEIGSMGAKVLHPRCIEPLALAGIPLHLRHTHDPRPEPGTIIERSASSSPTVTAVTCRTNITLVSVATMSMLRTPGFIARAFAPLERLGISVDLIGTSQSAVSFTLDDIPGGVDGPEMEEFLRHLGTLGEVTLVYPCGVVSVIGRKIRAVLHELGPALEAFQDKPVHLVSDSVEDLNLSFVVDEDEASVLVSRLHERLLPPHRSDPRFGSSWQELQSPSGDGSDDEWWRSERVRLLDTVADGEARYVYHLPTVRMRAQTLRQSLPAIDRIYYAMKANAHPRVVETIAAQGLGIECVSAEEVRWVRALLGDAADLMFTPNFCPLDEYRLALDAGAEVVIDNPIPLLASAHLFRDADIGLRIDPGEGKGHHEKVRTAGAHAKFGQPPEQLREFADAVATAGARVIGLHAHVGSGILDPHAWSHTAHTLAALLDHFPDVEWLDLGGGLGVPERPGQSALELELLQASLRAFQGIKPQLKLRIEPGRFLVSEAGVLLAPVTQVRHKGAMGFVGAATGMNSLLRPALYGSWHRIHNLTRIDEPATEPMHIVGPICETGDILGRDRVLPPTSIGDVLLIENAGAYGAVMASRYNMRDPAAEIVFE